MLWHGHCRSVAFQQAALIGKEEEEKEERKRKRRERKKTMMTWRREQGGGRRVSGRSMRGKLGMRMISVLCRCETVKEGIKIPVLKDYPWSSHSCRTGLWRGLSKVTSGKNLKLQWLRVRIWASCFCSQCRRKHRANHMHRQNNLKTPTAEGLLGKNEWKRPGRPHCCYNF